MKTDLGYFITCENYESISNQNYNQYTNYKTILSRICKSSSWDLLEHTHIENQYYRECLQGKFESAVVAIVFQALAIEAYINFYCYKYFGGEKFLSPSCNNSNVDIIETCETWKKITYIFKKYNVVYADEPIQPIIKALLKKRNCLVHYKTRGFDDARSSTEEFINHYHSQISFVYDDIDSQVTAYRDLVKRIAEIDGSQISIAEQELTRQDDKIKEILTNVIKETFDWY